MDTTQEAAEAAQTPDSPGGCAPADGSLSRLAWFAELLEEYLGVRREIVTPESRFVEDLGADSLDTIEIIMEVEAHWNVEIYDDDADNVKTVADALALLEQLAPVTENREHSDR